MKDNLSRIQNIVTSIDEDFDTFMGAVVPPVYESTIYRYPDFETAEACNKGDIFRYSYSKNENPTVDVLQKKLALMEKGEAAKCFSSGTSAMYTALMHFLQSGDHVITVNNVYGRVKNFLTDTFPKYGIECTFVDGDDAEEFEKAIRPNTRVIYLESPSTWQFELQDLKEITKIAKKYDVATIIDNTWATPLFQNPIELGVDVVVHSASKYLGGHSDLVAGVLVSSKDVIENLPQFGAVISPVEAGKMLRGLRTIVLRMERHQHNALKISKFLEKCDKIEYVSYPGLESHPQFRLGKTQMSGYSGLMSFIMGCETDRIRKFIDSLKHISIGGSWGGFDSVIYAIDMNGNLEFYHKYGYKQRQVRLSVGLEDSDVLLEDLDQALRKI